MKTGVFAWCLCGMMISLEECLKNNGIIYIVAVQLVSFYMCYYSKWI